MKKVEIKNGKTIETPWLRIEEAAAYVGLSRSEFDRRSKKLPHSGSARCRIYNSRILDAWLNGMFPDIPFCPEEEIPQRKFRARRSSPDEPRGIIHPGTGKFYPTRLASVPHETQKKRG